MKNSDIEPWSFSDVTVRNDRVRLTDGDSQLVITAKDAERLFWLLLPMAKRRSGSKISRMLGDAAKHRREEIENSFEYAAAQASMRSGED